MRNDEKTGRTARTADDKHPSADELAEAHRVSLSCPECIHPKAHHNALDGCTNCPCGWRPPA